MGAQANTTQLSRRVGSAANMRMGMQARGSLAKPPGQM
jgi:hypothetical protein